VNINDYIYIFVIEQEEPYELFSRP